MRIAPRVPKAPPTFVSKWIGSGVGEAEGEVVLELVLALEDAVGVGVTKRVTLNVVGTTATVATFWSPFRIVVLTVTLLVVSDRTVLRDGDGVTELEEMFEVD